MTNPTTSTEGPPIPTKEELWKFLERALDPNKRATFYSEIKLTNEESAPPLRKLFLNDDYENYPFNAEKQKDTLTLELFNRIMDQNVRYAYKLLTVMEGTGTEAATKEYDKGTMALRITNEVAFGKQPDVSDYEKKAVEIINVRAIEPQFYRYFVDVSGATQAFEKSISSSMTVQGGALGEELEEAKQVLEMLKTASDPRVLAEMALQRAIKEGSIEEGRTLENIQGGETSTVFNEANTIKQELSKALGYAMGLANGDISIDANANITYKAGLNSFVQNSYVAQRNVFGKLKETFETYQKQTQPDPSLRGSIDVNGVPQPGAEPKPAYAALGGIDPKELEGLAVTLPAPEVNVPRTIEEIPINGIENGGEGKNTATPANAHKNSNKSDRGLA